MKVMMNRACCIPHWQKMRTSKTMTPHLPEREMNMNSQARKAAKVKMSAAPMQMMRMNEGWQLHRMAVREGVRVSMRTMVWMKGMNYNTLSVACINRSPRHKSRGIFRRCHPTHRSTSHRPAFGGAG